MVMLLLLSAVTVVNADLIPTYTDCNEVEGYVCVYADGNNNETKEYSSLCDAEKALGALGQRKNLGYLGQCKPWHIDGSGYSGKCGEKDPKINGKLAECDPDHDNHCCNVDGDCSPGLEDKDKDLTANIKNCNCPTCHNHRIQKYYTDQRQWRKDGRCGTKHPLLNGEASRCDPSHGVLPRSVKKGGRYPGAYCCSKDNWCGNTRKHCEEYEGMNYADILNRNSACTGVNGRRLGLWKEKTVSYNCCTKPPVEMSRAHDSYDSNYCKTWDWNADSRDHRKYK